MLHKDIFWLMSAKQMLEWKTIPLGLGTNGVAVALCPGYVLIFNPYVTHCLSSQKMVVILRSIWGMIFISLNKRIIIAWPFPRVFVWRTFFTGLADWFMTHKWWRRIVYKLKDFFPQPKQMYGSLGNLCIVHRWMILRCVSVDHLAQERRTTAV